MDDDAKFLQHVPVSTEGAGEGDYSRFFLKFCILLNENCHKNVHLASGVEVGR